MCGGDGMSCKTVIKTFTDSVKFGYKTIGTIPAGSSNIKITEVEESRNYLGETKCKNLPSRKQVRVMLTPLHPTFI